MSIYAKPIHERLKLGTCPRRKKLLDLEREKRAKPIPTSEKQLWNLDKKPRARKSAQERLSLI